MKHNIDLKQSQYRDHDELTEIIVLTSQSRVLPASACGPNYTLSYCRESSKYYGVYNQIRPNDLKAIATFLVKVAIGTCITLATNIILFSCISKKAYDFLYIHVAMDW